MFLWAICFPLINLGITYAPPMTFAFLRAFSAGLVLLFIAIILNRPKIGGKSNWIYLILIGITATSIGFYGMFNGGKLVSPGIATVLSNSQPLFAAFLAAIFLHEKLNKMQICGIAIGFIGIVFISIPALTLRSSNLVGIGYILYSALGIAISNVILKYVSRSIDILTAMGWQLLVGSIPLGILSVITEDPFSVMWSLPFMVSLFLLSTFGTALPFVIWFYLLTQTELTKLNIYTFLTPVFGVLMGIFLYNEQLGSWHIAGIVVITLSIGIVSQTKGNID